LLTGNCWVATQPTLLAASPGKIGCGFTGIPGKKIPCKLSENAAKDKSTTGYCEDQQRPYSSSYLLSGACVVHPIEQLTKK
jgi:hypothetical protein